jgi:hypothetical protein
MSLLNFHVGNDRVILCVDTAVCHTSGARYEHSKMIPLLHANVVFALRGHLKLLEHVFSESLWFAADFDSLTAKAPTVLRTAWDHMASKFKQEGLADSLINHPNDVVIAGWSAERERMDAKLYEVGPESIRTTATPWCVAPFQPFREPLNPPSSQAAMLSIARRQADWIKANWTSVGGHIGGEPPGNNRLLVAELTRESLRVDSLDFLSDV